MFYNNDIESFKSLNGYVIDDVWYPRVTKIVGIKAKPALYRFYAEAASFKAADSIAQKSAAEGTQIHEAVEKILSGESPVIEPNIAPAIAAFKKFIEVKNIQADPALIEKRIVHHDHRYAGTIDVVALIDGKLGILDIKTSQAIYRDYNLQISAYMEALRHELKDLQTRWILRIDQIQRCIKCGATLRTKGGREKIKINWSSSQMKNCQHDWSEVKGDIELQEFPYWQDDFEAFLGAKRLWEWENIGQLKEIGYL
ncbi:MAG: hypothetical protein HYW34_03405, partial [Candidatus Brennerbacteria bacterium]|nr:hypothetical protein [Candidatus Brennerbacteria bacterium]